MHSKRQRAILGMSLCVALFASGCGGGGGGSGGTSPPTPATPVTFQVDANAIDVVQRSSGNTVSFANPQISGAEATLRGE